MIKKREKAQKWRLISINSLALAAPHWQAQHIQPQHGPGASSSGAFQERPVAQSQLGWERGGVHRPRKQPCSGPAVPRGPGSSCRDLLWKESLHKALPGARSYLESLNPASAGKGRSPPA